jgi:outer membrane biosynthesis protein TonB
MNLPQVLSRSLIVACVGLTLGHAATALPPFKDSEYRRPSLGPREPALKVEFPSAARARGVSHGRAEASVLVDADGKAIDFFITSETDAPFGRALVEHLQSLVFQPGMLRGTPVPARCGFSYDFASQQATGMNVLDASASRSSLGKAKPVRAPVVESKLDQPLEILDGVAPSLPKGFPGADKSVKVSVTFFVDETGQVRTPNIESAGSPQLFAPVLAALSTWKFKPPTAGGKPAVVFVGRTIPIAPVP